ncbi:hypothetical protein GHT06_016695 [Daphnia sinensis]|uniref:Uncharacterized protein n=1 Tax=Daphnia sinensis TaxID=1820382 RepID=A0AAD5L6D5_9CRUS|nr:hypothetical protein GHT06_016695 [Daphnia sinensis]
MDEVISIICWNSVVLGYCLAVDRKKFLESIDLGWYLNQHGCYLFWHQLACGQEPKGKQQGHLIHHYKN